MCLKVYDKLKAVWDRAGLLTHSEGVVVPRIERTFSGYGLAQHIGKQAVTGQRRPKRKREAEAEEKGEEEGGQRECF